MLEPAQMLKGEKHVLLVVNSFEMKIVDASQTVQEEDVESISGFGGKDDDDSTKEQNDAISRKKLPLMRGKKGNLVLISMMLVCFS